MTAVTEPGVRPAKGGSVRFAWALFDWAQQPYFTLVGSFVFRPYYVAAVAATPAIGQVQIGLAGTIAGLIVAIGGPLLGVALERGRLKAWLALTSLPFILACAALWWVAPGSAAAIPLALLALIAAAAFAEFTTTVNNAMLPAIARPGRLGSLSGIGVGLGCVGGLVSAAVMVAAFLLPEQPLLGLDKAAHEPQRFSGPFAALWYVVFVLPLFLLYPADARAGRAARPVAELWQLVRTLPRQRTMLWFLVGRMLAADALGAMMIFGGIIASTTFDWTPAELALFGILVLGCGAVGSVLCGMLDDRHNPKLSVLLACGMLAVALAGLASVTADHAFGIPTTPADGFLASTSERIFLLFAALLGVASGPLTGSMRSWMAVLSPPGEEGRWFGLYAVAGRATAFAAPLMVSIATALTGEIRSALVVILTFIAAGFVAFLRVPAFRPT